jgi:hypothetical protein
MTHDNWNWHDDGMDMGGQGEGFVSRRQLEREKALAILSERKKQGEAAARGDTEREEYWRFNADCLEFGFVEADRRRTQRGDGKTPAVVPS